MSPNEANVSPEWFVHATTQESPIPVNNATTFGKGRMSITNPMDAC